MNERRRRRLGYEIALVLVAKLLALLAIWSVWFAAPLAPTLDAGRVRNAIYSSSPAVHEGSHPHAEP